MEEQRDPLLDDDLEVEAEDAESIRAGAGAGDPAPGAFPFSPPSGLGGPGGPPDPQER